MEIFLPDSQELSCSTVPGNHDPIEIDDARLAMIGGGIGDVVPA